MDEHVSHHDHRHRRLGREQDVQHFGYRKAVSLEERERLPSAVAVMTKGNVNGRVAGVEPQAQQNGERDSTTANSTCANTSIARTNTRFGWGAVAK